MTMTKVIPVYSVSILLVLLSSCSNTTENNSEKEQTFAVTSPVIKDTVVKKNTSLRYNRCKMLKSERMLKVSSKNPCR